jgi:beta-glucosidase
MAATFAFIPLLLLVCVQSAAPVLGFTRSEFPEDFVFGSATSAYQVTDDPIRDSRAWIHRAFLRLIIGN